MSETWVYKSWAALSPEEAHAIVQLRVNVFVVEQNCVYPELDGKDPLCYHLFSLDGQLAKTVCRIVPPGVSYPEVSIGRVTVAKEFRSLGLGSELMKEAIKQVEVTWGKVPIVISAQQYLENFYALLGFKTISEPYLEDGIPHVKMLRKE